jgi:uncharacterized protein YbaP (TraB family)
VKGPALLLAAGLSLAASETPAQEIEPQDAIVVTAQRSGAPTWTIDTARGTILLVGEIVEVPKSTPWRPDRLEAATGRAQRVILGTRAKVSPGDILRLIFAGGKLTRLPKGTQAADYLDDSQRRRLAALEERYDQDYSRQSLLMTGFDLLAKRLGFNRDTGDDATEVVRRAANRADVPTEPVGTLRGEDILDDLFSAPPESHLPCLDAAMTATEQGPDLIERRGADWRAFDVPAVMANPLEIALGRCWPWADEELGTLLRGQWTDAIYGATDADGITLAVVPLRVLAEHDGVLDQLERRGLRISGPAWR